MILILFSERNSGKNSVFLEILYSGKSPISKIIISRFKLDSESSFSQRSHLLLLALLPLLKNQYHLGLEL